MEISKNHKVFVIDDKYEEALPVLQSLAIKGIFTIYWNGSLETKPEEPLEGIRFVFLDMRFSAVTDSRSINTYLFTLLRSAISIKNGPYILFIWSKHDNEYLEEFKKEIFNVKEIPKPYLIINMEKNNFIKWSYEKNEVYDEVAATLDVKDKQEIKNEILELLKNYNISDTIETINVVENGVNKLIYSLDEKLKEINSLAILLMWENLVNISAKKLVNDIASFSEISGNWDNNIKTLIQHLAVANAGKSLGTKTKDYVLNALSTFNQMLPDELWNQLMKNDIDEKTFNFINNPSIIKTVDENVYSISKTSNKYIIKKNNSDYASFKRIDALKEDVDKELCKEMYKQYLEFFGKSNFKLLCERITSDEIKKPGSVYEFQDDDMLQDLCNSILKKQYEITLTNISLIKLDVSSSCDYAQNKLKRIRILPGIMVEESYFSAIDDTEDIYCTPELEVNNKLVKLVFNFHYITNESKNKLTEANIIFSFRELLLTEIKHKLSSYISRVGIINL
ncbi:hypothetical protein ACP49_02535 [Clostridium botulinum]|uniref:hypothetical protein n=1 Tax=Clostridium botulinum TaxID=1491 RepID=UPI0006A6DF39|nr:hypothetical protein [Clostridium botulinum]KOM96222.1 hypothetical protein ACP53_14125 [Clostridium botulinum]KON01932.1 hypothetical protein ACP49_02535 [Clostridium botulinum]MBY7005271.1 hypothetical protein [Clostridium botulinum]MCR1147871.1 hypothetical protein [Clostridium botulinum]NFH94866.1 hypothetical protein [Clostridium botulinum]